MHWLARLLALLRSWFRPALLDAELSEELRLHLDRQIQMNLSAGMSAAEARRSAHLALGSIEAIREESRRARPGALVHEAARDVVFGARLLRRAPGFAVTGAMIVALGVGAATTIFSIVYGVMLRPLPFPEPDRLVAIWTRPGNSPQRVRVHPADYLGWRTSSTSFEDIALVFPSQNLNLTGWGEPERLFAAGLSANTFDVFGVRPALGRAFREDEDDIGAPLVVILSDGLWRRRFGADPSIVGRTVTLSGAPFEVVGVMGPEFQYPGREHQLWVPLTIDPRLLARQRASRDHLAVGRLKTNASIARAQREMDVIARRLETEHPATNRAVRAEVLPLFEESVEGVRPVLYGLLAAVGCLLLIACLNLAGLLGARAAGRAREFSVRLALGASRGRLTVQALAEVAPILVVGGLVGLAAARLALSVFVPVAPVALPRVDEIEISGAVLAFSITSLMVTGLVTAFVPAVKAWRTSAGAAGAARAATTAPDQLRMRSVLVIAQVALTLPLLVASAALVRSFSALMAVDPGFRTENVLTMHMAIARSRDRGDEQIAAFYTRLVDRVAAIPGVVSAGMVNRLPLSGNNQYLAFQFEGVADEVTLQSRSVTPDYFRSMGIPLREGRVFTERDTAKAPPVAVIDQGTARALWPGERAIGKRYRVALPGQPPTWSTIVGVVGAVRHGALEADRDQQIYFGHHQFTDGRTALVVRSSVDARGVAPAVLQAIRDLDPNQPVYDVRTMDDVLARSSAQSWLGMVLVTAFAASALLLAGVGLYGAVAYGVAQRMREFGIRLALGAARSDVVRQVVNRGLLLAVLGSAVGLGGAVALTVAMKSLLFGVEPVDPLSFGAAVVILLGAAFAASFFPARQAALTNPSVSLRAE